MQATVSWFDETSQDGSLLLDDGTPLAFASKAFAASGLRLLRVGQRVRVEQDSTGEVVRVSLTTLP